MRVDPDRAWLVAALVAFYIGSLVAVYGLVDYRYARYLLDAQQQVRDCQVVGERALRTSSELADDTEELLRLLFDALAVEEPLPDREIEP